MARTQIGTTLIEDGSVRRVDINTTLSGSALITKLLVNSPLTISSTGVDPGTGDVTLGLSTANLVTSFNTRVGAVTLSGSDVTTALGFTPISGYTETDTLATVTGRGATTNTSITVGSDLTVQADGSANYTASRLWLKSHNNYRGAGIHMSGVGSTWFAGTPYTDFDGGYVIARTGTADDVTSAQYSNALFTVKSTGNVGIGTNNPQTKIHLGTTNSSVRIDTSLSNSAFLTGWQDAVAIGVNRDPQNGNFTNTSKAAASIFLYGQANSSFINFSTTTSNNTLPTERMRLESSGNLLINTTTDSGYKLNVNGTVYIGGVATLNSNANIAGSVATPQITARKYFQNPDGVPTNNLGDPTVTEMALFDEQFNNKTAFYNNTSLTFWTSSDGVNYTEYTGFSTTAKKRFLGGDTDSGVYIPNLTNRFRIELENTQGYVFLNALYLYWSSNSHSTQVHIWKQRCDNGVWYQHTNSATLVSSWPGHLYLPFSSIAFLPLPSTSSSHFNRIRIEFIPTWSGDATWGSQHIYSNRMQIWGGYPAGKRNLFSTDEDRNVTYPANITAVGTITSSGVITATGGNSTNWNTAFGWGNHASVGYQTTSGTVANIASGSTTDLTAAWTAPGTSIGNGFRVYRYDSSATNKPVSSDNANWLINIYSHPSGGTSSYGHQLAAANTENIYFRQVSNGSFNPWRTLYHSGNFTDNSTNWNTAYTNRITSLTTTGSSGAATLSSNVLNIPNYTLAGLGYSTPTLAQVTTAGNTTTNAITVGGLTVDTDTLSVDATNNRVGIGTTSPSYKLHVTGDIGLSGNLVPTGGSQSLGTFANRFGDIWAGGLIVGTTFYGDNLQSASGTLYFKEGGGVEKMRMTSGGNFLVGTSTDSGYKVDISGTLRSTSNVYLATASGNVGIGTLAPVGLLNLYGGTGGNPATLSLQSISGGSGNTGIYFRPYQNEAFAATAEAQGAILATDASYSMHMRFLTKVPGAGTNSLTERMRLTSVGNLLVGTIVDNGYKLDISGTANISNNVKVGSNTLVVDTVNNRVGIGGSASPTYTLEVLGKGFFNEQVTVANGDGISFWTQFAQVKPPTINALGFYTGTSSATERMRITSAGYVLIGTTTSNGSALQVNGTVDGQSFAINGVAGWTGTIMIMGNPPGMQNIQVDGGIITNVF